MNIIIYTLQMEQQLNELNELHARLKIVTDNIKKTCDELVYWKKIDGYNYSVSKNGEVRNDKTMTILKGRLNRKGYISVHMYKNGKEKSYKISRLVAKAFINNPDNKPIVDHINNIKTDNNITNLRWATDIENGRNAKLSVRNTSNVKGVSFSKSNNKWRAQIQSNKKSTHIGYYKTIEEAKEARKKKAKELFGEFLNECEL